MKQLNLHFSLSLKYEDAIKAVRTYLFQNGFGMEDHHDVSPTTSKRSARTSDNAYEIAVFDAEHGGVQTGAANALGQLPRVVISAGHEGFAEVFVRHTYDEDDSSAWQTSCWLTDARALRLAKALLEAGRSAFLQPESISSLGHK